MSVKKLMATESAEIYPKKQTTISNNNTDTGSYSEPSVKVYRGDKNRLIYFSNIVVCRNDTIISAHLEIKYLTLIK